jgi:carbon-monoxide dehydrogenase large subunit
MLHAVFVRSQHAHGRIRSIDVAAATAMPGVVRVLTGEELLRIAPPVAGGQLSLPAKWRSHVPHAIHNPQQPILAVGKVRHVGEAVAVVVAESRDQAVHCANQRRNSLSRLSRKSSKPLRGRRWATAVLLA